MSPTLQLIAGEAPGPTIEINQDAVRLGRANDCEVVIDSQSASRLHARLVRDGQQYLVEDLSRYGTFVNGQRVQGRAVLRDQDRILISDTLFVFCDPADASIVPVLPLVNDDRELPVLRSVAAVPPPLNVYAQWLGIRGHRREGDHYQLLRLSAFEDDQQRIVAAFRKLDARVRALGGESQNSAARALRRQLTTAYGCLSNPELKRAYDAGRGRDLIDKQAGEKQTTDKKRAGPKKADSNHKDAGLPDFAQLLLARKLLIQAELAGARHLSSAIGIDLLDAVLQGREDMAVEIMQCHAASLSVPYVDLAKQTLQPELIDRLPAILARQHSLVPLRIEGESLLIAASRQIPPAVEDQLRMIFGVTIRGVICTPQALHDVVNAHYSHNAVAAELASASEFAVTPKKTKATRAQTAAPKVELDEGQLAGRRNRMQLTAISFFFVTCVYFAVMHGSGLWMYVPESWYAVSGPIIGLLACAAVWPLSKFVPA